MKFKIGELVREGGSKGPISRITNYKNGIYEVKSLSGNATGYLEECDLIKYKQYEQLKLF